MKAARKNKISGQFSARLIEMLQSPAFRILSLAAHRVLARIEIEHAAHGGTENGRLPVTYDDLADYGVHRTAIGPALAELQALGFVETTEHGKKARAAEYRRPNMFRLTYRHCGETPGDGTHDWRRFKTLEEAQAAAVVARAEIQKPPVRKTYRGPVRKTYYPDAFASTESVPLRMSESVPLSISRDSRPTDGDATRERERI